MPCSITWWGGYIIRSGGLYPFPTMARSCKYNDELKGMMRSVIYWQACFYMHFQPIVNKFLAERNIFSKFIFINSKFYHKELNSWLQKYPGEKLNVDTLCRTCHVRLLDEEEISICQSNITCIMYALFYNYLRYERQALRNNCTECNHIYTPNVSLKIAQS